MIKKNLVLFLIPLLAIAVGGVTLWPGLQDKAVAQASPITINFVHGIPSPQAQNLDICIRADAGEFQRVVTRFSFDDQAPEIVSQQADGLPLVPGNYDIVFVTAGAACNVAFGGLQINGLDIEAGSNVSIIAHLTEDGSGTTLSGGFNNISQADPGESAVITIYHAAALPRADFRVGRPYLVQELFTFLGNGEFGDSEILPGSYNWALVPAGAPPTSPFIQEDEFPITPGANNVVYIVGSQADGSLTYLWQDIPLIEGNPSSLQ